MFPACSRRPAHPHPPARHKTPSASTFAPGLSSRVVSTTRGMSKNPIRLLREGRPADFIGRVQDGRRQSSAVQATRRPAPNSGNVRDRGARNVIARPPADRACARQRRCAWAKRAHGQSACACRGRTDGRGSIRPNRTPGNARSIVDAPRPRVFGRQGEQEMRLNEFQTLFIKVALSTGDLRSHRPVGMRHGLFGRRRPHALERPVEELVRRKR